MTKQPTPAQRRALEAVAAGKVTRAYNSTGNVLRGPEGVGARALWGILRAGWITDGPSRPGIYQTTSVMVLTVSGRQIAGHVAR